MGALDLASGATFKVAKIHRLKGDPDQALEYYERCLQLSRSARKVRTEANALSEIATVYYAQGRPEQTLKQYRRLQRFYESIGDRRGQALALNTQGDFLLRLEKGTSTRLISSSTSVEREVRRHRHCDLYLL